MIHAQHVTAKAMPSQQLYSVCVDIFIYEWGMTLCVIASVDGAKDKMRELMGDDKALPPKFFRDGAYLGVSYVLFHPF